MTDNMQKMFSLISGELYTIPSDELNTVDDYQVPIKDFPKSSCKKCYGRLYTGLSKKHNLFIICKSCSSKLIEFEKLKSLTVPSNAS